VFRHQSPVYRLTGYLPIFPIIFREKAAALLTAGNAGAAYSQEQKTVFQPGLAARGTAGVLNAVAGVSQALEQQISRAIDEPSRRVRAFPATGCQAPWQVYCQSVFDFAPGNARHDRHLAQQHELRTMVQRQFAGRHDVNYLDLGAVVDLANPAESFDGMHPTPKGNSRVAAALVPAITDLISRTGRP